MSEFAYKIRLPEELYNKVLVKAQKRTLSVSAYIRDLLIADLGELGAGEEAATKEEKQRGAPKKITPYLEKYADLGVHPSVPMPSVKTLPYLFDPVPPGNKGRDTTLCDIAYRWLVLEAGMDSLLFYKHWPLFLASDQCKDYADWRDDPSGLLGCFANVLYVHANPE